MFKALYLVLLFTTITHSENEKDTSSEDKSSDLPNLPKLGVPNIGKQSHQEKSALGSFLSEQQIGHPDEDKAPSTDEDETTTSEPEVETATDADADTDDSGSLADYNQAPAIQMPAAAVIRCSRRFTPGSCPEPVQSVWTYVFEKQMCVERLGCPKAERSNRFKSLNRCTRRCASLTNIYTDVLAIEEGKHKLPTPLRRWHNYLGTVDLKTPLPKDYYNDNDNTNIRPVARENPDYAIERNVLRSQEYTLDEETKVMAPDVDSFAVEKGLVEDFHNLFT